MVFLTKLAGKTKPAVPSLFQIYKSSAGSGKTYTLVKEYLKIVLKDPSRVRNILAITFTNAAAAEMKDRIIRELGRLSGLPAEYDRVAGAQAEHAAARELLAKIQKEWAEEGVGSLSDALAIKNAGIVLKYILHNYSEFSVGTIDSFVHRIIRTFAFDLHVPLNFEVELDADALLEQAVDILISRAGADQAATQLLISFLLSQAEDGKDIRIEKQIARLAKTLMDEAGSIPVQKLRNLSLEDFLLISREVKEELKRFEAQARITAGRAMELIGQQDLSTGDFAHGRSGIGAYFEKITMSEPPAHIPLPGSLLLQSIEEDKWFSTKAKKDDKARIEQIKDELLLAYREITGSNGERLARYKTLQAVVRDLFPVAVLNEVEKVLEEIKAENVLLHISDFNKKIAAIIAEQPVPFIYERLGEKYRHYMIDEFQDTSVLQWQNLIPLVDNALAGGNMSLVVGDGKQAIYRFRNGDVEQFVMLPALSREIRAAGRDEWERSLKAAHARKNLDTNFRSQREIVEFNNRFFGFAKEILDGPLRAVYEEVTQKHLEKKNGGYVEVSFVEGKGQSYIDATLDSIVGITGRCREAGHSLGDITILCRAADEASRVSRKLLEEGIPVISSESLLLNQSDEVNFILALLRLLADPGNQVAVLEAVSYLRKRGIIRQPDSLPGVLSALNLAGRSHRQQQPDLQGAFETLLEKNGISFSFRAFAHQNLYDICETIVRSFFAGRQPPNPFVAFLSDAIYDFAGKNRLALKDFLEWWEEKGSKYSLVIPEGVQAVRVMTIHKSKGLQFPVVICPFAHWGGGRLTKEGQWAELEPGLVPGLETTWISLGKDLVEGTPFQPFREREREKSTLDLLNLVYVAFTRPAEKLFVLTKTGSRFNMGNTHGMLHHFLKREGRWQDDQLVYPFGTFEGTGQGAQAAGDVQGAEAAHPSGSGTDSSGAAGGPGQDSSGAPEGPGPFREIISSPWSRALRMRSHQVERQVAIGGEDPMERGNLLHRAMEKIFSHKDIQPVLEHMVARGEIDQARGKEWEEKITRLISLENVRPFFEAGLTTKPEAGLFDEHGNFFRPDRVVLMKDQTAVIDYKTGKPRHTHREQVTTYAHLLEKMGYPNVRKLILYLDRNEAVEV